MTFCAYFIGIKELRDLQKVIKTKANKLSRAWAEELLPISIIQDFEIPVTQVL